MMLVRLALATFLVVCSLASVPADDTRPKRLLLIGQGPDNHRWSEHEYMAGQRILAELLQRIPGVQTVVVRADGEWAEGPELLDGADAAVVFVSQGAKWVTEDADRLAAFRRLAKRKGGLAVLHWGMGTREPGPIANFVALFGGCHGGPDRKYKVVTTKVTPADHSVTRGLEPFEVHEEFYYRLKFPTPPPTPLLRVPIDGDDHTVAWAWNRPDGGRSFGFSGLHFHRNWARIEYCRLVVQAVLWTVDVPLPEKVSLDVDPKRIASPRPRPRDDPSR